MPEPRLDADGFAIVEPDTAERARLAAQAVAACTLCDSDGYRGAAVCDHTDHRPAAKRGMAKVRETMGWPPDPATTTTTTTQEGQQ